MTALHRNKNRNRIGKHMENEILKKLQRTEFEILLEIDRICKKHQIKYMLCAGTMLGAVRHKGFIPWDDDIDIMMPLRDYSRFCRICRKDLKEAYFLQTFITDNFNHFFAKVRKNGTLMLESETDNYRAHGIWIDIFPIVGVKNEGKWCAKKNAQAQRLRAFIKKINSTGSWRSLSVEKKLLRMFPKKLLLRLANARFLWLFHPRKKREFCYCLGGDERLLPVFPAELFESCAEVHFEGNPFYGPKQYDKYLTLLYGDYLTPPPPEKRTGGCHTVIAVDFGDGE